MQSAVSRQKQLITVSAVANAQKQEAIGAECTEASSATMFQELEQNAKLFFLNIKRGFLGEKASFCFVFYSFVSEEGASSVVIAGASSGISPSDASSFCILHSAFCISSFLRRFSHSSYSVPLLRSKSRRRTFW